MKSVLIVTNFNAGRKKAIKYKKKVIDFVLKYTKSFKAVDIDEFYTIDVSPFDTILVMGGDGTVNKILPYVIDTDKTLGIIPCGTANLLSANLGLSQNINKTLKIISKNNIKIIDCIKINEKISALRCGIGYDANIICKTPQSLKNKFGYFAYFIAGIIFALRLSNKKYDIAIDNKEKQIFASCIIISNAANMYKNFAYIGNNSKLDDGLMDIFILKVTNPIIFFFEFLKIIVNIRKNNDNVEYIQSKRIAIKTNWLPCHIDGEKVNIKRDFIAEILPQKLRVYTK